MSMPIDIATSDLPQPRPAVDPQLLIACHLAVILAWDLAESTVWREHYDLIRDYEAKYPSAEALEADPIALAAAQEAMRSIDRLLERIRSRAPAGITPASGMLAD